MSKIFQLISSIQLGGAENVSFELAQYCGKDDGNEREIVVIELYPTHDSYAIAKKKELSEKNIQIVTLYNGSKRMSLIYAPFALYRLIKKENPSIIHSHTDLPDLVLSVALKLSRLFGIENPPKIIRTIHNTQLWRSHKWLGRVTESQYRDEPIVSVSLLAMNAYEQLREKYGLPISTNRQIIYNGFATPKKSPHPFETDESKYNIAFCGRYEDYKGMDTLIPAIVDVERLFPGKFLFHLIGNGSYKNQLQQLSQQVDNVIMYDPIPNIPSMFHAFDYLFMPSHFEGLTLISIEASFAGVPVIASFAPGLDETLPENWPLKFHLDKREELYGIFENIDQSVYDRQELQKMASNFVTENFSLQKMVESYNKLYYSTI